MRFTNLFERFASIHARHVHVKQHDIRFNLLNELDAFKAIARLADDLKVGLTLQERLYAASEKCVIVNEQNSNHFFFPLSEAFTAECGKAGFMQSVHSRGAAGVGNSPKVEVCRRI